MEKRNKHIISIGDHCAPAICLKQCGLRTEAFPFDWIVTSKQCKYTCSNFAWVVNTIIYLISNTNTVHEFVEKLFHSSHFDRLTKTNHEHNIWFPHDSFDSIETRIETKEKYMRRFNRLITTIRSGDPITFILISRGNGVDDKLFKLLHETLSIYNPLISYVWVSGIPLSLECQSKLPQSCQWFHVPPQSEIQDPHMRDVKRRPIICKILSQCLST